MSKFSFLFLPLISFISFDFVNLAYAESTSCNQEWASESNRMQGGGWIWFPGRGESNNLSIAILKAEGSSLDYLQGECQSLPKSIKFNERCIDHKDNKYLVKVRASIRAKDCSAKSESNRELVKRLINYRSMQSQQSLNTQICNQKNPVGCYQLADKEWRLKNQSMAIAYSESACLYGDQYSCGFLGFLHYQMGNARDSRLFLEIGCKRDGTKVWCDSLSDLEKQLKGL